MKQGTYNQSSGQFQQQKDEEPIIKVAEHLAWYIILIGALPFSLLLMSEFGYFDSIYRATLGIPSKDHRIYYSGFLALIAVNIAVAGFVSHAFTDPEEAKEKKNK